MNISAKGRWSTEAKSDNTYILKINLTTTATTPNGPPATDTTHNETLLTVIDHNTAASNDGSRRFRTAN